MIDRVERTLKWFEQAVPEPKLKNQFTQLGNHVEEFVEMLKEISSEDSYAQYLVESSKDLLSELSDILKKNEDIFQISNKELFLDSLCDQYVTALGAGHMFEFNMTGSVDEVNDSNWSKFDENGNPIFDENMKIMKGPNYFKPNLKQFV